MCGASRLENRTLVPGALRPEGAEVSGGGTNICRPHWARAVVKDAQTINQLLGYEMNTIEFAIAGDVPYAIDFLNPAPDFERDRITEFYFDMVVEKMARLVIDRALHGVASHPCRDGKRC